MINHVKSLIWVGVGAAVTVSALWGVLQQSLVHSIVLGYSNQFIQNQKHMVAYGSEAAIRSPENEIPEQAVYSGVEVLHSLRDWASEGAEVIVEGIVIESYLPDLSDPAARFDEDLRSLLSFIEVSGSYKTSIVTGSKGELLSVRLNKD